MALGVGIPLSRPLLVKCSSSCLIATHRVVLWYKVKSAVYKMADNKFNLYQQLPTTGAEYVHAFTHKGKQYLAVVKNYGGKSHKVDSPVYIWN